jgi:hypothetical protein
LQADEIFCVLIFLFELNLSAAGQMSAIDTIPKLKVKKFEKSLLVGYNQGYYGFAEIGIELNKVGATSIHDISVSYIVSNEIKFGNKTTIGPKIGFWIAAGPAAGLNLIYYTDFSQSGFVFRPEIGFGATIFKLVYGYNFKLSGTLENINHNQVNVTICLNFKKWRFEDQRFFL